MFPTRDNTFIRTRAQISNVFSDKLREPNSSAMDAFPVCFASNGRPSFSRYKHQQQTEKLESQVQ
ncbi:hypothetical protein P5673_017427 [Acropora cervicornis]|uniref:Uncharacterized protein n=1 Tax=Acropora cervicornis TaxID=6130 RepID=A0AAD9V3Y9_ACRCE|nr:hypothetical protein P5673_017427 [Acropora cervicornis]